MLAQKDAPPRRRSVGQLSIRDGGGGPSGGRPPAPAEPSHEALIQQAAQFRSEMTQDDVYELLERCVEIGKHSSLRPKTYHYRMMFPHPLPVGFSGARKLDNDVCMREISHLPADKRCWRAVTSNMPWCLEELYLTGFSVSAPNEDGLTPLHLACHFGFGACVEVLLNAGAPAGVDVNASTTAGVTPLASAEAAGHVTILAALRARGAVKRLRQRPRVHRTVVDIAVDRGGRSVAHDVAANLARRPDFLQF